MAEAEERRARMKKRKSASAFMRTRKPQGVGHLLGEVCVFERVFKVDFYRKGQAACRAVNSSVYCAANLRMGDRAVDCARLESVCAARHRGFESPPIRHLLFYPS